MPQIEVVHPFILRDEQGKETSYGAGQIYEVDQATADHWLTKAHTKQGDEIPVRKHPHEGDSSPAGVIAAVPITEQSTETAIPERFATGKKPLTTADPGSTVSDDLGGDDKGGKSKKGT